MIFAFLSVLLFRILSSQLSMATTCVSSLMDRQALARHILLIFSTCLWKFTYFDRADSHEIGVLLPLLQPILTQELPSSTMPAPFFLDFVCSILAPLLSLSLWVLQLYLVKNFLSSLFEFCVRFCFRTNGALMYETLKNSI